MKLSPGQLTALRGLRSKKAGEEVDWINIAHARALTELGLAERNREGWIITAAGEATLELLDPERPRKPSQDGPAEEPL